MKRDDVPKPVVGERSLQMHVFEIDVVVTILLVGGQQEKINGDTYTSAHCEYQNSILQFLRFNYLVHNSKSKFQSDDMKSHPSTKRV